MSFPLSPSYGGFHRIFSEPDQARASPDIEKISSEIIDSAASITLQRDARWEIEQLLNKSKPYIDQRNKILESFFYQIFPRLYSSKLSLLDKTLDDIEQQIYLLESDSRLTESDLEKILLSAEARLKKYS